MGSFPSIGLLDTVKRQSSGVESKIIADICH